MAPDVKDNPGLSDAVRSFITATPPRYASIATTNADGTPHQNVIWYLARRDASGDSLVLNSRRGRRWPTNLDRTRRASLAIHAGEVAVTLRCGVVDIYDGERAQLDIEEMARRYDPPERGDPRMERFRTEDRISFVLRPLRVHTHGDPS
jgi:hypothetical protein